MIGWILDLIFSNFWIVILLFWGFRLFSKGFKEEAGRSPRSRENQPKRPRNVSWETDLEEVGESLGPAEIMIEKKREPRQPEKQPIKNEKTIVEPMELPSPVQGMIWSQIYGPPRSKNPHHKRRTR